MWHRIDEGWFHNASSRWRGQTPKGCGNYPFTGEGEFGRPQAIRLNERGEVWEDFLSRDVVHPRKGVTWNPQAGSRGFQRYAKRQTGLLVVLRTRIDAYPTYYFARIERAKEWLEHRWRRIPVPDLGGASLVRPRTNDGGNVMLAVVPQMAEQDETIPVDFGGPLSVIRLMPLDGIDDSLVKSGQPWNDVLLEFWDGSAEEELQVGPLPGARWREIPNQVVQEGRKVIHEVASVQSKARRGFPVNLGLVEIVSALSIEFGRGNAVRVLGEELRGLNLEVVQVELRPLQPLNERPQGANVRSRGQGEASEEANTTNSGRSRNSRTDSRGLLP